MIRFEEHDNQLFLMLEEPVPLTDDAELPVLVRLIQNDTMLGKANKRSCSQDTLAQKIICINLTDDGLFLDGNYAYRYEIIGYPVGEGSAEWALWRLMQGDIVMGSYWGCDVMVTSTSSGWHEVIRLNLYGKRHGIPITDSDFLFRAEKMGWQIYHEPEQPKPESENIIHGHIPADMHLKYFHLHEFKVGEWVEKQDKYGNIHQDCITAIGVDFGKDFMTTKKTKTLKYDRHTGLALDGSPRRITRKLDPSNVVIHIGCLSGTVKDLSYAEDGRFWLIGKATERCPVGMYAILYEEMLDTHTAELVRELLKAQEEEGDHNEI